MSPLPLQRLRATLALITIASTLVLSVLNLVAMAAHRMGVRRCAPSTPHRW